MDSHVYYVFFVFITDIELNFSFHSPQWYSSQQVALLATVTLNDSSVVHVGLDAHSILVHSTVLLSVQVQYVHGFGRQESLT